MYTEIKSFEDACKARKYDANALPDVSNLPAHLQNHMTASYKLLVIAEAINADGKDSEPWQPDWSNYNQRKYFAYFEVDTEKEDETNKAGFGFSVTYCVYWDAGTSVGSRLCFDSREKAVYFGETFADLHIETQLIR